MTQFLPVRLVVQDPVEYVQNLLDQRDKYDRIVTQSFNDDKTFRNALNQVGGGHDHPCQG